MIEDRRRPGEQRVQAAGQGRHPDARLVKGPVQPPPDALQDLQEVPWRRQLIGHSPDQRRVQVGVRADVAWQYQGAGAVPARHAWRGGPDRGDPVAADHHVGAGQLDRVEAEHHGAAAEREGAHRRRASLGTAATAAAESFIGSLVR